MHYLFRIAQQNFGVSFFDIEFTVVTFKNQLKLFLSVGKKGQMYACILLPPKESYSDNNLIKNNETTWCTHKQNLSLKKNREYSNV